ncbi:MAG: hypothetical protein AAGA90_12745 [Actinomycetota bacterium]
MSQHHADRRFARLVVALAAVALLAAACGGGDDESADDASAPSDVADESASASTAADEAEGGTDDGAATDTASEPAEDAAADGDDATTETDTGTDDEPDDTTTTSAAPTTTESTATTTTLPAETGLPPEDERGENEAGVRIDLDETATLTCANAEFARDALRQSMLDVALQYTAAAADRAEPSAVVELAELVPEMRAAQTEAEIDAVIEETLEICVERGHQI